MMNRGSGLLAGAVAELWNVNIFFAQKSFKIYLPPEHHFATWGKSNICEYSVEDSKHRF